MQLSTYDPDNIKSRSKGYFLFLPKCIKDEFLPQLFFLRNHTSSNFLTRAREVQKSFFEQNIRETLSLLRALTLVHGIYDWRPDSPYNARAEIDSPKNESPRTRRWTRYDTTGSQVEEEEEDEEQKEAPAPPVKKQDEILNVDQEFFAQYKSICLTNADMDRLNEGEFLNDNIIDFYLQHLHDYPPSNKSYHLFHTTFYPLLKKDPKRAANRVPQPTYKLYDKDFIFLPVNEGLHWMLLVVCYPRSKYRCIMYCDSLDNAPSERLIRLVQDYMRMRWTIEHPESKEKAPEFKSVTAKLPCQQNYCDCGVYLLQYVELILDENFKIAKEKLPINDKEWFTRESISQKRATIRSRIEAIKWKQEKEQERKTPEILSQGHDHDEVEILSPDKR
jgi:Ulp1 family protease